MPSWRPSLASVWIVLYHKTALCQTNNFSILEVATNEPLFWNGRRITEVTRVTRGWGTLAAARKKKEGGRGGGANPTKQNNS